MKKVKKLTEKEYWDEVWQNQKLPKVIKEPYCPYYVNILDGFFHKYLFYNENFEFLELGCAPGRWLHYFHSEFGYKVNGLENSVVGFEMTKKNLEMLGVKANIFFGDALNFEFNKKFDLVFSSGLIEHFLPPTKIIQTHLDLIKIDGYIIITIPNLKNSIYYYLQKIINKKVLKNHLLLNKNDLLSFFRNQNVIICQYLGVFSLYILNLSSKSITYKIIYYLELLIEKFLKLIKIKRESSFFSPMICIIIKKS